MVPTACTHSYLDRLDRHDRLTNAPSDFSDACPQNLPVCGLRGWMQKLPWVKKRTDMLQTIPPVLYDYCRRQQWRESV
jgi:hypothetical protein